MKTLGITVNAEKKRAREAVELVCRAAAVNGFAVVVDEATASLAPADVKVVSSLADKADMVIALGGDGTILRVVRELNGADRPVMGVNIGSLGFLTSISLSDIDQGMLEIAKGSYVLSRRALVECRVMRDGEEVWSSRGLNDVVIANASPSRVVTLDVAVDRDKGTSYVGDGLIVATPSGSTGHSLSAGGPIVHPGVRAVVMSLICPQTLSSRPMVIPEESIIHIQVRSSACRVMLTVDGQVSMSLEAGDAIEVGASPRNVSLVHMKDYSYFGVLRKKLHWRLSNALVAAS